MFSQYYSNQYGGPVFLDNGYIPVGVPEEVNEAFLIAQLNYLLDHIKELVPNNTRWNAYNRDWNVEINSSSTLFDYLKTVTIPADAAKAWTYLYEYPGDIKATSVERAATADDIFALYTGSASLAGASCGGSVSDGGMNLEQAQAFMGIYSQIGTGDPNGDRQYINNTIGCHTNIDNCVVFSAYFVRKYTNINFVSGNGGWVVANTSAGNPGVEVGTVPKAYSVFSITKGTATCMVGGVERVCGHTGIVLGVDVANDKVITGEASWCDPSWTGAHEHSLSEWSNGDYSFLYAADYIKEERKAELN